MPQESQTRYHGLDALRGIAMMLGIVLHAALPYVEPYTWDDFSTYWPQDSDAAFVIAGINDFIHSWRMPTFFILSGFFTHLVIARNSWQHWYRNRFMRILLPLIIFSPLMAATLPPIFNYGFELSKSGEASLQSFLSWEGYPFHLWFLWHLLIFAVGALCIQGINKILYAFCSLIHLHVLINGMKKAKTMTGHFFFDNSYPVSIILLLTFVTLWTGGDLLTNPLGSSLYFVLGYRLYVNEKLLATIYSHWKYYFNVGLISFVYLLVLISMRGDFGDEDLRWILYVLAVISTNILLSYGIIGFFMNKCSEYNKYLKFIADSSYWIYLVHLPIVTLITFVMLPLNIFAEIKFILAIGLTSLFCLVSYKLFVRSTIVGLLLNGKTHPFRN